MATKIYDENSLKLIRRKMIMVSYYRDRMKKTGKDFSSNINKLQLEMKELKELNIQKRNHAGEFSEPVKIKEEEYTIPYTYINGRISIIEEE